MPRTTLPRLLLSFGFTATALAISVTAGDGQTPGGPVKVTFKDGKQTTGEVALPIDPTPQALAQHSGSFAFGIKVKDQRITCSEQGSIWCHLRVDGQELQLGFGVPGQGGLQPHWRRDGHELFYLTPDGIIMSVPVNPGPNLELGASEPLCATGFRFSARYRHYMNQYSVSRDGQRFLVNRPIPEAVQDAITAVIPW